MFYNITLDLLKIQEHLTELTFITGKLLNIRKGLLRTAGYPGRKISRLSVQQNDRTV